MVEIIDITEEFNSADFPKNGRLVFEDGFRREAHQAEIETAEWLLENFGGDIVLLCESKKQGEKMPDYTWRTKYWERKGIASAKINTINQRVKTAYAQIDRLRGGVIFDFGNSTLTLEQAVRDITKSVQRYARGTSEIIILKKGQYKIFRIIKR